MSATSDPGRTKRTWGVGLLAAAGILSVFALMGIILGGIASSDIGTVVLGLAIVGVLPAAIGAWLLKQAGPAPPPAPGASAGELPPMSVPRIIFATFGILAMVFSGGCALVFLPSAGDQYVSVGLIAMLAGPPFLAGLLIWWLAAKVGRR